MNEFGEVWLNLGSGIHLLKNFINCDFAYTLKALQDKHPPLQAAEIDEGADYVMADIRHLPFTDNSVDYILAFTSIEHLPIADVIPTLAEWRRVLKPSGRMEFVTVNFDELAQIWTAYLATDPKDYQSADLNMDSFRALAWTIYGNQLAKGEYHHCPFNPRIINYFMNAAGWPYWEVAICPTGTPVPRHQGYPLPSDAECYIGEKEVAILGELHVKGRKEVPDAAKH